MLDAELVEMYLVLLDLWSVLRKYNSAKLKSRVNTIKKFIAICQEYMCMFLITNHQVEIMA